MLMAQFLLLRLGCSCIVSAKERCQSPNSDRSLFYERRLKTKEPSTVSVNALRRAALIYTCFILEAMLKALAVSMPYGGQHSFLRPGLSDEELRRRSVSMP